MTATTGSAATLAEAAGLPAWLTGGLRAIEDVPREQAILTRVPFTYAYDYLRGHTASFDIPAEMSRAEMSGWLGDRLDEAGLRDHRRYVCGILALAYIEQHNLHVSDEVRDHLLAILAEAPGLDA